MSRQLVFTRKNSPQEKIQKCIKKYKLKCSYKDSFESVYLSEYIIMSVTKRVVWILISGQCDYLNIETDLNKIFNNGRYEYEDFKRRIHKYKFNSKK